MIVHREAAIVICINHIREAVIISQGLPDIPVEAAMLPVITVHLINLPVQTAAILRAIAVILGGRTIPPAHPHTTIVPTVLMMKDMIPCMKMTIMIGTDIMRMMIMLPG